jgi:hypothetical protein
MTLMTSNRMSFSSVSARRWMVASVAMAATALALNFADGKRSYARNQSALLHYGDTERPYPRPKSRYAMTAGAPVHFNANSLDNLVIVSPPGANSVQLPPAGSTASVTSQFDATVTLNLATGPYTFTAPADVSFFITGASDGSGGGGGGSSITWPIEIQAFDVVGDHPLIGELKLRESPVLTSIGNWQMTSFSDPPNGYMVDSFFDVFFDLSIDGGPFRPASAAAHLRLTSIHAPEPATAGMILVAMGAYALVRRRQLT